jgi:diamine N-acetyltransferase
MSIGAARIVRCGFREAPVIADIGRRTFVETYADQTSAEDMREHLTDAYSRDQIEAELAEPDSTFFVAEVGDAVAGYLKVNRGQAQTELREEAGLEIESLYVLKTFQGHGIGAVFLDTAFEEARGGGAEYVWLGVWERNSPARRFWERMGFVEFDSHSFSFGTVEHTDLMMKRELGNGPTRSEPRA